ncbi:hypothetical protein ACLK1U_05525 [Escherichia coli]
MNSLLLSGASNAAEKKSAGEGLAAMADGAIEWSVPEGNFWDNKNYSVVLPHLDRWVSLMRMHGGAQAE